MISEVAEEARKSLKNSNFFALIWKEAPPPPQQLLNEIASTENAFSDSEEIELNVFDIIYIFFLATVIVASILGNGLIGLVLYRKRTLTPSSRLVFVLCVSNLGMSLFVLPFSFASSVLRTWIFGNFWCWISAFIVHLVVSASNATLAAIAVDRYFAIVKPMSYAINITGAKTILALMLIWSISILINLPQFFNWPQITYEKSISVCLANLQENSIYSVIHLIWDFLLPGTIMTSSYGFILKVARSKYKKPNIGTSASDFSIRQCADNAIYLTTQTLSAENSNLARNCSARYARKPSWLSIVLQSPVKGFAVISCILGVFFIYWLPYVASTVAVFNHWIPISCWQRKMSFCVFILSIPSYPVIYGLLNRSIRKDLSIWLRTNNNNLIFSGPITRNSTKTSSTNNNNNPNSVTTLGVLDYTPPFLQWCKFSQKKTNEDDDDSGRFSLTPDEMENVEKTQEKVTLNVPLQ